MPLDNAYGVIPVHRSEDGKLSVLLVAKRDERGSEKWWGFPKGHPDGDEGPQVTAARELKEETGLSAETLGNTPYADRYVVEKNGVKKDKTVTLFIGRVSTTDVVIQPTEIDDYRWVPYDIVTELLSYDSTKSAYCAAQREVEILT